MENMLSQQGKVALITGGASGIGLATAELFAAMGAAVYIVDWNKEQGKAAEAKVPGATFCRCDVTNETEVAALAAAVDQKHGKSDVLFNNAGVIRRATVVDMPEADWDIVLDVTLKGAYLMSKYFIPLMKKAGGGSIINTGSGWGLKGGDKAAAYCAAKGGIVNLTRALAIDHGPDNIRVNCVCPGDTATPLLEEEGRQLHIEKTDFFADAAVGRPLARIGQPADIAKSVLFFASELSEWVTGASLPVDGGGIA